MISKPIHLVSSTQVDQSRRQTPPLLGIKDLLQDILLPTASGNIGNADGVGNNRQSEGDALWQGFGRVGLGADPGVLFAQELMTREEGAGVTIGTTAEENHIENGELDAILGGEDAHQVLLVQIGEFLGIIVVDVIWVDGMDFGSAHLSRDFADQLVL